MKFPRKMFTNSLKNLLPKKMMKVSFPMDHFWTNSVANKSILTEKYLLTNFLNLLKTIKQLKNLCKFKTPFYGVPNNHKTDSYETSKKLRPPHNAQNNICDNF